MISQPLDGTLWHPYAADPFPGPRANFVRGEGSYVFDEQGTRYFDSSSSWWCVTHGHRHPALVEALIRQANTLDHVMMSPHRHPAAENLSERLLETLGAPYSRVFFTDNGSTAVEAALRIALQYWELKGEPKRQRFGAMRLSYHGDTLGAAQVGGIGAFQGPYSRFAEATIRAHEPYCYRCPVGATYPGCATKCLDDFERMLEERGDEVAAVIVEPLVMGAAGMVIYPQEVLERFVALARKAGALVIFDEVFTGFGRTGKMFAFEHGTARPDLICLSKGLTAGMLPLGAVIAPESVYEPFRGEETRKLAYGHTFSGNPLACAVADRSLRLYKEEGTLERIAALASVLEEAAPQFAELPQVGNVRTLGGIFAVELVTDRERKALPVPANGPGWEIAHRLWKRGVWLRPLHNVVYILPPYCTSETDLRRALEELHTALA